MTRPPRPWEIRKRGSSEEQQQLRTYLSVQAPGYLPVFDRLCAEIRHLTNLMDWRARERDEARAEVARLEEVQRGTALESDERGARMNELSAEVARLEAMVDKDGTRLSEFQADYVAQLEEMESALAQAEQNLAQAVGTHDREVIALRKLLRRAEQERDEAVAVLAQLVDVVADLREQLRQTQETGDALERWAASMPDVGLTDSSPRWKWWHAGVALRRAWRALRGGQEQK